MVVDGMRGRCYSFCRMPLHVDDVRRLAELARIQFADDELERFKTELDHILGFVDRLAKIDTARVPETSAEAGENFRPDEPSAIDDVTRELILSNFPDRLHNLLRVPAVFDKPKG